MSFFELPVLTTHWAQLQPCHSLNFQSWRHIGHSYRHVILWTSSPDDTLGTATATSFFELPVLTTHWAQLQTRHSLNFQSWWHIGHSYSHVILWTSSPDDTLGTATAMSFFELPVLTTHWAQLQPCHSLNFQSWRHIGHSYSHVILWTSSPDDTVGTATDMSFFELPVLTTHWAQLQPCHSLNFQSWRHIGHSYSHVILWTSSPDDTLGTASAMSFFELPVLTTHWAQLQTCHSLNFQSWRHIGHSYRHVILWTSSPDDTLGTATDTSFFELPVLMTHWAQLQPCHSLNFQSWRHIGHSYRHVILWTSSPDDTLGTATDTSFFELPVLMTHWAQLQTRHSLNFQSWRHIGHSCCTCCELSHFTMQCIWKQCEHLPQTGNKMITSF